MYKAVINTDWMNASCNSDDSSDLYDLQTLAGAITLEDLLNIMKTNFAMDPELLASSQGKGPHEYRKSFPLALAGFVSDSAQLLRDAFEHSLVLLDGHGFVWGWWLHLFLLLTG